MYENCEPLTGRALVAFWVLMAMFLVGFVSCVSQMGDSGPETKLVDVCKNIGVERVCWEERRPVESLK